MDTKYPIPVDLTPQIGYRVSTLSGSTAKATRRQIRRALGPAGLEAINATALAVDSHVLPSLDTLQRQLDSLTARVEALERA
jgi:hypothetical protein